MKKNKLKITLLFIVFGSTLLFATSGYNVSFSQPISGEINLDFDLENYNVEQITKDGVTYSTINFENSVTTKKRGFAELPFIHAAVQLSETKNVTTEIITNDYVEYQLDHPLLPSRGTIYRNQDPSSIPYEIANESIVDEFYPGNIAEAMEPFIIRDVRGAIVYVYPFQYNAEQNILRVFENVTVKLTENSSTPINPIYNASERMTKAMNSLYRSVFINYTETRFEHELDEFGSILVIHTPRDASAILPYIEWKREKGFTVYAEEVATGTNVISLVSTQFASHDDILYVQLVGDWNDISGTTVGGTPTDPTLGCLVGGDVYPDLIVGRFSASYADQVTTQVNKAIGYEKTPEMGGDWYSKGLGIGSEQGAGIGDDGEADYIHIDVIKDDKLLPFTYTEVAEAYQYPSQALVSGPVNNGLTIINYCGHGSITSWGTSGFNNTSVNNLSNGDKLPFIISVACVNGAFQSAECFAEAWLHKSGGGAVGMLASTINMSWAPPMRGQDYINDLLIGGYDYAAHPGQNGITTDVQKTTYGAVCLNGSILMVVEDYSGGLDEMQHWTIFGDAALQVRTDTPQELSLSNTAVLMGIDFSTTITTGGTPVEGAMVALSQDGEVFSGISDENGNVTIDHGLDAGICTMVVTGFNTETIYDDDVTVIPPGGPYVIFESYIIDDTATGNGNGSLENGEIVDIDMSVENLGTGQATNAIVTISSTDPYITIIDNTENFGNIAAGDISLIAGAFTIEASEDIPDSHMVNFELEVVAEDTWISYFSIEAYAPTFPPENLTAEIQDFNDVILTWEQPSGTDNTRDLTGYKIYKDGLMIVEITDLAILTYTDFTLAPGDYEYHITALFHAGESGPSNIELVTIFLPAPQNPEAVTQYANILVTWDEPASRAFSHYKVYRDMIMIADDIMETSYLDPAVPNGTYCYNVRAVYSGDYQSSLSTDAVIEHVQTNANDVIIPVTTELTGNYPNPFNPITNVNFSLKADSKVSLSIYNVRGHRVKTLVADNMQAGYHSIVWDGRDDNGKSVSSGIYFSGFDATDKLGDYTSVKKMILLK